MDLRGISSLEYGLNLAWVTSRLNWFIDNPKPEVEMLLTKTNKNENMPCFDCQFFLKRFLRFLKTYFLINFFILYILNRYNIFFYKFFLTKNSNSKGNNSLTLPVVLNVNDLCPFPFLLLSFVDGRGDNVNQIPRSSLVLWEPSEIYGGTLIMKPSTTEPSFTLIMLISLLNHLLPPQTFGGNFLQQLFPLSSSIIWLEDDSIASFLPYSCSY